MANDYFQDIVPPSRPGRTSIPINVKHEEPEEDVMPVDAPTEARSIRNISVPARPRRDARDIPPPPGVLGGIPRRPRRRSRAWLWALAVLSLAVLGSVLLIALRNTTVTVIPRSHTVVFDDSSQFTAYPIATAATGTLAYRVETVELDDSEVVPSTGTVTAQDKASGTITVYNNYSEDPVRLVKNTRFESSGGMIFRAPAEIAVPGKRGTTPGQVRVTVVADQPGQQYNVAAGRFTLPGLKSSADMYAKVYAQSDAAMSGGFVGDKPGVSQSDSDAAVAAVRSRLEQKAIEAAKTFQGNVFSSLMTITYEQMPNTSEAGGGVRIHERARILVPVFPSEAFASTIARTVSAAADTASIRVVGKEGFDALNTATSTALGTDPLTFKLTGTAQLVWNIDQAALQGALAGKEKDSFQSIVTAFPGIQEARARIEPFWSDTFPANGEDIKIKVEEPSN